MIKSYFQEPQPSPTVCCLEFGLTSELAEKNLSVVLLLIESRAIIAKLHGSML